MTATVILLAIATGCFMVRAFKPMIGIALACVALACVVMGLPPIGALIGNAIFFPIGETVEHFTP